MYSIYLWISQQQKMALNGAIICRLFTCYGNSLGGLHTQTDGAKACSDESPSLRLIKGPRQHTNGSIGDLRDAEPKCP